MDKVRALRNLRYQMRKKGYTFLREDSICIMPTDEANRSRKQEARLKSLGVCIQYNMFTEEEQQKKGYIRRLVEFVNQVQTARVSGNCNKHSRLSLSVAEADRGLAVNVQIYAHDPGHPERPPIFNSNYWAMTADRLEDLKNSILCIYMDIEAGLFFNKMSKNIINPLKVDET